MLVMIPIIVLTMIINIVVPDKKISEVENRSLQSFPAFSVNSLLNGEFEKDMGNWFSDQFVGRNTLLHIKYIVNKMTGVKQMDNVFLSSSLIEQASSANAGQLSRNLDSINSFYASHANLNFQFLLIPNAVSIQSDLVPKYAYTEDQNQQMDTIYGKLDQNIKNVDVRSVLKSHADEYLYYKTDHHWTSLNAFYTFQEFAKASDLGKVKKSDYNVYPVKTDFKGTLANKTGSVGLKDTIEIYVPKENSDYIYTNTAASIKSRSLYSLEALDSSNPYNVFLSGNAPYAKLEMNNDSQKHLLVFKDSYANAFIPFLVPYYRTITIVDPRYYFDDIESVVTKECISDVLYLYNANTFVQDTSLSDVLGE